MATDKSVLTQIPGKETGDAPISGGAEAVSSELAGPGSALLAKDDLHRRDDDMSSVVRHLSEGSPLANLPMQLDVTIPIPEFRVHNLLTLEKGTVLESGWNHTEDVPVWCGGMQLVWAEFEVVDKQLSVRVTRVR